MLIERLRKSHLPLNPRGEGGGATFIPDIKAKSVVEAEQKKNNLESGEACNVPSRFRFDHPAGGLFSGRRGGSNSTKLGCLQGVWNFAFFLFFSFSCILFSFRLLN